MARTNFGEFGEFGKNSPKLVLAKIKYFVHSPKLVLAKIKLFGNLPKLPYISTKMLKIRQKGDDLASHSPK